MLGRGYYVTREGEVKKVTPVSEKSNESSSSTSQAKPTRAEIVDARPSSSTTPKITISTPTPQDVGKLVQKTSEKYHQTVEGRNDKVKSALAEIDRKISEKAVSLEAEGSKQTSPVERLKTGTELAVLGLAKGALNVAEGVYSIGKQAVSGDVVGAGKSAVQGTIEWAKSIPETLKSGFTESPFYAGKLAGEIIAGEAIAKGVGTATKPLPKPAFAKVSEIVSTGAETKTKPIRYGVTLHVMEKPLLTVAKKGDKLTIRKGAVEAPLSKVEGKTITATSKLETEFFRKTVKELAESPEHAELFETGYKLAKEIYKTKEPIVKPEKFDILSKNIPEPAKEVVKDVIKSERGIEVYGSVPQKLQMGKWMTRQPKDIEVIVKDVEKFTNKLTEKLKKAGMEFKIEGKEKPKVYFKQGGEWVKGIEIFPKKGDRSYGLGLPSKTTDIAYGFEKQKPIKIEGIPSLRLSEQTARKLEGGHVFSDRRITPKHTGRFKDISDLIEIATAYSKEKGVIPETDVVKYTELATKLYGEEIKTPIAKYVKETGKLPDLPELKKIMEENKLWDETYERELLYFRDSLISEISSEISSSIKALTEGSIYAGIGSNVSDYLPPRDIFKPPYYSPPIPKRSFENPLAPPSTPPKRGSGRKPSPPPSPIEPDSGVIEIPPPEYDLPPPPGYDLPPPPSTTTPPPPTYEVPPPGRTTKKPPKRSFGFDLFNPLETVLGTRKRRGVKYNPVAEDPFSLPPGIKSMVDEFTGKKKRRKKFPF